MTRYDVIRTMQQAGLFSATTRAYIDEVERFAHLVAAAEREACAQVCDAKALAWRVRPMPLLGYSAELEGCAAAIRARGQA